MIPLVLQEAAGRHAGLSAVMAFKPVYALVALSITSEGQRYSSIDPANGIDTSEMANFLNMFCRCRLFTKRGLVTMVDVLNKSYQLCDPMNECTPHYRRYNAY